MFKWSNRSLSFKYGSVYVLTIILFLVSALLVNYLLEETRSEVASMNQSADNSQKIAQMEVLMQERFTILAQHMINPQNTSEANFNNTVNEFNSLLDSLEAYIDSDEKQTLLNVALDNDYAIIDIFENYITLRESEKSANFNRGQLEQARRSFQQSTFSLNQLKNIFESEREEMVGTTYQSFDRTNQILTFSILISVIIGTLILVVVNRDVKKRLTNILSFSEKIENGDLTVNNINMNGKDEFSKISTSLNTMKSGIEEILGDISNVSNNINDKSEDLEQSATFLNDVSKNVSSKLNELIAIVEEQSAAVVQISHTNESFNGRINTIEKSSMNMKESSLEVASTTKEGIELMNESVSNIDSINRMVANSASKVNVLVEKAADISQITELINKVAEKTNLLALNASIEAARAGSYGRGFAVVAEEIRSLSSEVNQSINDMNIIIQGIQQEADEVEKVLLSSNEKTQEEQKKMEKNISYLTNNASSIDDLVNNIDSIYTSLLTMTKESDEINDSLEELTRMSEKTTLYINEASDSIYEQNNIIHNINDHSSDLYTSVGQLNASMSRFSVKGVSRKTE
ncbi:methyl-accepting chemotaxis protein [Evansella cellulosilytica]|uniref:Methyl-accepting chemotaxis sensory transducer n=1 Tax=Evansella cellulosilytica (strain ATCC 21833 / DSM 2522 / FERM P-1141 / JCM 9156 / N-4) TaxID=649639 RepID=E6TVT1_EVAC2|nr:methyl-accepting chemotaxis protein [Evansella cellulosilytica]ADU28640.1 methyl-accepting chemotaxis sensory transducer [Evansella cellulosilytica DSM 2522]